MMNYYVQGLPRCPCGKPATHAVHSSGTVRYFAGCERCCRRHLRELQHAQREAEGQR